MRRDKRTFYAVLCLGVLVLLCVRFGGLRLQQSYTGFSQEEIRLNIQAKCGFKFNSRNQRIALQNRDPRAHCCNHTTDVTLDELCGSEGIIKADRNGDGNYHENISMAMQECTCLDFFYCKLVVVTAFSSNHYEEAQDMIASVQFFLPNTKVIVYDIGMTDEQRNNVSRYCNVELQEFHFDKYPPHTKDLTKYAWKPLVIDEVSQQYEVVLYGDASVRLRSPPDSLLTRLWQQFPFVSGSPTTRKIISLTHDGMIRYLNITTSRKEMGQSSFGTMEANCWIMWVNSVIRKKLLDYWVDCALHEECIAPSGAHREVRHCNKTMLKGSRKQLGPYIGCHRYDQSALNLILIREFGLQVWESAAPAKETVSAVFKVTRYPTNNYSVVRCEQNEEML